MSKAKKLLSIILIIVMVITIIPVMALADTEPTEELLYRLLDSGGAEIARQSKNLIGDVVIPEEIDGYTVTSIAENAFKDNTKITSVTIPSGVTDIGANAFYRCTKLEKINWNAVNVNTMSNASTGTFYNAGTGSDGIELVFDDAVTEIPANAFYVSNAKYAPDITSISFPENLESIGDNALKNLANISEVELPENLKTIGINEFYGWKSLEHIEIPDSVESIGKYAFYSCSELKEVKLSDEMTDIGEYFFARCEMLETVEIPESITSIGSYSFYDCLDLGAVELPSHLESIGANAFEASGITEIEIPASVEIIASNAFKSCDSLKYVFYTGEADDWSNIRLGTNVGAELDTAVMHYDSMGHYADSDCEYLIEASKAATCTENGYDAYSCNVCGDIFTIETTAPHDYVNKETVAPTCSAMGFTVSECVGCGDIIIVDITETDPGNHNYIAEETVDATCTEQGFTVYKCADCGAVYEGDYTELAEHIYVELDTSAVMAFEMSADDIKEETVKEHTCTPSGSRIYVCVCCDDYYMEEYDPETVTHAFGDWYVSKEATCVETGERTRECEICGYSEKETFKENKHKDDNGDNACDNCGKVLVTQKKEQKKCSLCDSYRANKDRFFIGAVYSVIHGFVHLISAIGGR